MTALGLIDLRRSHGYCNACRLPCFAADALLGIGGFLTLRARSMACLAGLNDPFRKAGTLLSELAGWRVCAETLRKCCYETASDAREHRAELGSLPEQFEEASGQDREAHIDAGKVNTPDGWRDIKLVVFACRERGILARLRTTSSATCRRRRSGRSSRRWKGWRRSGRGARPRPNVWAWWMRPRRRSEC